MFSGQATKIEGQSHQQQSSEVPSVGRLAIVLTST